MTAGRGLHRFARGFAYAHQYLVEKLGRMPPNSPPESVAQDNTTLDSGARPRSENGRIPNERVQKLSGA
jgi:hypothetical protein